jgi:hypothetical protein
MVDYKPAPRGKRENRTKPGRSHAQDAPFIIIIAGIDARTNNSDHFNGRCLSIFLEPAIVKAAKTEYPRERTLRLEERKTPKKRR